jgi:hypothetical protein
MSERQNVACGHVTLTFVKAFQVWLSSGRIIGLPGRYLVGATFSESFPPRRVTIQTATSMFGVTKDYYSKVR